MTALTLRGLTVEIAGRRVLDDVSLDVDAGRVTGLIGPNGAGKTTLIDAVTGFTPSAGEVLVAGRDARGLPPHARAGRGIARTFQTLELFEDLSVAENVLVAAAGRRGTGTGTGNATAALDRVGLRDVADRLPRHLPRGDRAMVALARALAAEPAVLLLDEPGAGADAAQRHRLAALLRELAGAGTAVVLVDHDTDLVLGTCDVVHVLSEGRLLASGTPDAVRSDPAVRAAYLGAGEHRPRGTAPRPPTHEVLVVEGLSASYGAAPVLDGVDLRAAAGEVVTVLGRNGAGKSTLLRVVAGLHRPDGGRVRVGGGSWAPAPRPARRGVALVPQGRGLFGTLTAGENLRVAAARRPREEVLSRLPDLPPLLDRPVAQLSGGQQQQLALARALLSAPRLLLVDELSLGLAPRAVDDLLALLREAADRDGTAVLLVEQHAALALATSDRVALLDRGRLTWDGTPAALVADREAGADRLSWAYLGRPRA